MPFRFCISLCILWRITQLPTCAGSPDLCVCHDSSSRPDQGGLRPFGNARCKIAESKAIRPPWVRQRVGYVQADAPGGAWEKAHSSRLVLRAEYGEAQLGNEMTLASIDLTLLRCLSRSLQSEVQLRLSYFRLFPGTSTPTC